MCTIEPKHETHGSERDRGQDDHRSHVRHAPEMRWLSHRVGRTKGGPQFRAPFSSAERPEVQSRPGACEQAPRLPRSRHAPLVRYVPGHGTSSRLSWAARCSRWPGLFRRTARQPDVDLQPGAGRHVDQELFRFTRCELHGIPNRGVQGVGSLFPRRVCADRTCRPTRGFLIVPPCR